MVVFVRPVLYHRTGKAGGDNYSPTHVGIVQRFDCVVYPQSAKKLDSRRPDCGYQGHFLENQNHRGVGNDHQYTIARHLPHRVILLDLDSPNGISNHTDGFMNFEPVQFSLFGKEFINPDDHPARRWCKRRSKILARGVAFFGGRKL